MTLTPFTEDEHRHSDIFTRHVHIRLIIFDGVKHILVLTLGLFDISSIFAPTRVLNNSSCRKADPRQTDPTLNVRVRGIPTKGQKTGAE